jgi:threonine/homoserine/homoserine lactone efflux protein
LLDMSLIPGFLIAVILINISPGPEMIFVVSTAVSSGKKQGMYASLGTACGSTIHVLLVACGLAVVLSTSLVVFTVIKILGAVYLCYLGVKAIVSRSTTVVPETNGFKKNQNAYKKGFFVGVLNPKSVIFFLAFLPQFINPEIGSYSFQVVSLGLFTVFAGVAVEVVIILLVDRIVGVLRGNRRIMMMIDKLSGLVLICFGLKLGMSTQKS